MTDKLDKALRRLNSILPLKARQDACGKAVKELHRKILHGFVDRGRILEKAEWADYVDDPEEAAAVLKQQDMVVFSANGDPLGAYPFTMQEREHRVQVNGQAVFAMCALDALSISPMFGMQTRITSRCRVSGDTLEIEQSDKTIENPAAAGDICFGIAWGAENAASCCADSLCTEMIFLKNSTIAQQWHADDPGHREIFSLQEAIEFGSRFFCPLLSD